MQKFFSGKGETHIFCNRQAIQILRNDGKLQHSSFFDKYINELNRGVLWADKGWKNFAHYFDPVYGHGLGPWPNASLECQYFFEKALHFWVQKNKKRSVFFLGAAVHLVQDLCVPHHSRGIAFCGHNEYEMWVQENCNNFGVFSDGIYCNYINPVEWVEHNAKISRMYFPYVSYIRSVSSYKMATKILLSLAQRSTAGFLSFFLDKANSTN